MRWAGIFLLLTASSCGCIAQPSQSPDGREANDTTAARYASSVLELMLTPRSCYRSEDSTPPREAELRDFRARISRGKIVEPVNLSCVYRVYDIQHLRRYADNGDGLALYALVIKDALDDRVLCSRVQSYEHRLTRIAETRTSIKEVIVPTYRFPEAYYSAGLIAGMCHQPGSDELREKAFLFGYAPRETTVVR